jgi:hypothetical protein
VTRDARDRPAGTYSSGRRTALVLCGTGAHGAYLTGALRALQEAGVRIDLVAGHGVGAAIATLASIDGGARLWDADGLWHSAGVRQLYSWTPALRAAGWLAVLLGLVLAIPLVVLAGALVAYGVGFFLSLLGLGAGAALTAATSGWLSDAFAPEYLPTIVPRLAVIVLVLLVAVLAMGAVAGRWRRSPARRSSGGWWWHALSAPIDATAARGTFADALWQLIRGAAPPARPAPAAIGRRLAEVLGESLGQPGFRELIVAANDLDARRDVVLAMVADPYRTEYVAGRAELDRRSGLLDLATADRDRAFDIVAAAVTPPLVCDPALVSFSLESAWRGETHRLCDRPGACRRLLEEVAAAGVSQAIVVSAVPPVVEAHRLSPARLDPRHRLGDVLAADEAVAFDEAVEWARTRFDALYTVRPVYNAVGPFDLNGVYDHASDRFESLAELMAHGYEDTYRGFVESVVAAGGEHLGRADRRAHV